MLAAQQRPIDRRLHVIRLETTGVRGSIAKVPTSCCERWPALQGDPSCTQHEGTVLDDSSTCVAASWSKDRVWQHAG